MNSLDAAPQRVYVTRALPDAGMRELKRLPGSVGLRVVATCAVGYDTSTSRPPPGVASS